MSDYDYGAPQASPTKHPAAAPQFVYDYGDGAAEGPKPAPVPVQTAPQPTTPKPLGHVGKRAKEGVKEGVQEMVTGPAKEAYHGLLDPPRDATEMSLAQWGLPIHAYRLGKYALADAKDSYEYMTKTIPKQASQYMNEGKYPEAIALLSSAVLGPQVGKVVGQREAELISGVRPGGDLAKPLAKDLTEGLITAVSEKAPEATANFAKGAFKKRAIVVAAANDALAAGQKQMGATLDTAIKTKKADIGAKVAGIVAADKNATAAGTAPSFTLQTAANDIQTIASKLNPASGTMPMSSALVKLLGQQKSFTWETLKDLRAKAYQYGKVATGKDKALLGELSAKWGDDLAARAAQVGKDVDYKQYTEAQTKLTEHGEGIAKKIGNANDGLDFYKQLADKTNRPQLNDMFHLLNIPTETLDNFIDAHQPLATLADAEKTGDNLLIGRIAALRRHPVASIVGGGAPYLLPINPYMKFLASTYGMSKASALMDKVDAVTALRDLQGSTRLGPTATARSGSAPSAPASPQSGGQPPTPQAPPSPAPVAPPSFGPTAPAPATPQNAAAAGATPSPTPAVGPPASSAIVPTEPTPLGAVKIEGKLSDGPPIGPTIEDLRARQREFDKFRKMAGGQSVFRSGAAPKEFQNQLRTLVDAGMTAEEITDGIKAGKSYQQLLDDVVAKRSSGKLTKGGEANVQQKGQEGQVQGQGQVQEGQNVRQKEVATPASGAKVRKPKAFEQFGIVLDPTKWKTPEEAVSAKRQALEALEQAARQRGLSIKEAVANGTMDAAASSKAVNQLLDDAKKARLSIEKTKVPEVSRAARDRIRKGTEAFDALGQVGEAQARAEASTAVTDEVEAGIAAEKYEKLIRQAGHGKLVDDAMKAHFDEYDGNYKLLAEKLEAIWGAVAKGTKK